MFIPQIETGDRELELNLELSSKLNEMDSRISEIEDKIKGQERNVKRLAEALSSG